MIELLSAAVSVAMTLGTVWVLTLSARRRVSAETYAALDRLEPTDEQLQREREAYILLRTTWKPAPGSPLDWSLGLLQDECQKKIDARARPPAPRGTSATSRGGTSWTREARDLMDEINATVPGAPVHEHLAYVEHLHRARVIRKAQISDQEAIRQLHADTEQMPPTAGRWKRPDWLQTEDVIT